MDWVYSNICYDLQVISLYRSLEKHSGLVNDNGIMCHFTLVLSPLLLHRTYCLPIMRTQFCILQMFIMIIIRIYILFKVTLIKLDIFLISLTSQDLSVVVSQKAT